MSILVLGAWGFFLVVLPFAFGKLAFGLARDKGLSSWGWGALAIGVYIAAYGAAIVARSFFVQDSIATEVGVSALALVTIVAPLLASGLVIVLLVRQPELDPQRLVQSENLSHELRDGPWRGQFLASRKELDFRCELSLEGARSLCIRQLGSNAVHRIGQDELVRANVDGETLRLCWNDERGQEHRGRFRLGGNRTRHERARHSAALAQWIARNLGSETA